MIGVIGSADTPDGVWWNGTNKYGMVKERRRRRAHTLQFKSVGDGSFQEVTIVDGLILATQYDISWNEDVFDGWHFYDASQCAEFRKAGYKVAVIGQTSPMCLHDCGKVINMNGFEHYRSKYFEEYGESAMTHNSQTGKTPGNPVAQYYDSERRDVLACIPGKPKRILEIGCARGTSDGL